jgi:hypothetical protein
MRSMSLSSMRWITAGVVVLALAACSDAATSPGRDPQIVNATDNFQYQISDIRAFSGNQVYTWQNSGTTAKVNQSAAITSGAVSLVLRDANGTQVYSRSLADNGTFVSSAGVAGTWTVVVSYATADATVNFRVDKAP